MKILVGSRNPVKIKSVEDAFKNYFDAVAVTGVEVESGVSNQPIGDETFIGAKNRVLTLMKMNETNNLAADFFVGIEGGIVQLFNKWFAFGCMCVADKEGDIGFGLSPHFELPEIVVKKLLNGIELGDVMDEIQNQENTKQKLGAIGYFTNGVMNRKELYAEGLKAAVVPFLKKDLYFADKIKGKSII
ncbi:MAG: NTPase [Ignavibacteria bacterium]|nr:MAG: NTPase [Ignavibacteria bacterium]KAF0156893.1 MAG: NTPase [Ignavibacteria bacterium]